MRRFHLYRSANSLTYAIEDSPELNHEYANREGLSRVSAASVSPEVAIRTVLADGGIILRKGRRPWRTKPVPTR